MTSEFTPGTTLAIRLALPYDGSGCESTATADVPDSTTEMTPHSRSTAAAGSIIAIFMAPNTRHACKASTLEP